MHHSRVTELSLVPNRVKFRDWETKNEMKRQQHSTAQRGISGFVITLLTFVDVENIARVELSKKIFFVLLLFEFAATVSPAAQLFFRFHFLFSLPFSCYFWQSAWYWATYRSRQKRTTKEKNWKNEKEKPYVLCLFIPYPLAYVLKSTNILYILILFPVLRPLSPHKNNTFFFLRREKTLSSGGMGWLRWLVNVSCCIPR